MSHDLNFRNGQASLFVVREPAWHGLGIVVETAQTSEEAIKLAQLDFKVKKGKAFVRYDEPIETLRGIEIPNTFFTYRDDTGEPLCIDGHAVTAQYQVIQNTQAFDFFDSIVGSQLGIFETAGALRRGETIFITAKLPNEVHVSTQDKIDQYLLMTLNHDGTSSVSVMFTPVRVVCNNTLQAALSGKGQVRIRHSSSYKEKLEVAKKILGIESTIRLQLANLADSYANTRVPDDLLLKLICTTFLTKEEMMLVTDKNYNYKRSEISTRKINIISDVVKYTNYGPGQQLDTTQNTLWGFVNGVTGYFQNSKDFTSKGFTDSEKKFDSMFFGSSAATMNSAFNVANSYKSGILTY